VRTKNLGVLYYPMITAGVKRKSGNLAWFNFLFDSGADVTMMRAADGEFLGVDVKAGKKMEFGTAGESTVSAYLHETMFRFGKYDVPVRVAFAENDTLRMPLLGRLDICDFFNMSLNGRERSTILTH
jgi:hypothetical protein